MCGPMTARKVDYLLVGGGLAAANCARWLREEGAGGEVLLVGRETDPPYNRPECSKGYLRGDESRQDAYFRPDDWWAEQNVELLLRTSVTALDLATRTATLSSKDEVSFEHALIATGANVRRLNVDGCHLEGIHYLRSFGNADAIRAGAAEGAEVVLIGGSFIACEVAASLTALGCQCTIVMLEERPLEVTFGPGMGSFFGASLQRLGVRIHGGEQLERFEGDGHVAKVVTARGLELAADIVVIGAGVMPDVQLASKAGLELGERGGVRCSSRLETSVPGVYAAGDICEYESVLHGGRAIRVEHWDVAFNHGKTVALNMLGRDVAHEVVPYFYSVLAGLGELEYVGPAYSWDEELLRGSLEGTFTNWYLEGGRVKAALTWGRADDLDAARRLIAADAALDDGQRAALADADADLGQI
jgi:3-phenylpropionate/trans-cinnamate dioxygenase ferredoxin reductase subunit